jgi:hypothetical protein
MSRSRDMSRQRDGARCDSAMEAARRDEIG